MLGLALVLNAGLFLTAQAQSTSYDYIVVGGGTSGATLAARIAEDSAVTVALVEAGTDKLDKSVLLFSPGADVVGCGGDDKDRVFEDWKFKTVPQAGAAYRSLNYARGKGIGGSSQRNFMIYQRPTADSFTQWTNATSGQASPGWAWSDVFPYFAKSVVLTAPDAAARGSGNAPTYNPSSYPSTDKSKSPLPISFSSYVYPYSGILKSAFKELKYPEAADFNAGTLNGVQYNPSTINQVDGHRASSQWFTNNAKKLTNLKVITNARATKVNFNSAKAATGVTYVSGGKTITISAKREVVLSAGAFQSPQLLMLSGIGPAAQLKKFGIPVIVDLPGVGANMQDHVFFTPSYEIKNTIYNYGHEALDLNKVLNNVLAGGDLGSLRNPIADYLGWQKLNSTFINSKPELKVLSSYPPQWPHIEYIGAGGLVQDFHNLLTANYDAAAKRGKFYFSLLGTLVAPQSRGSVTLKSANPLDLPNIDPGWLTSKTDQTVAIETYKKVRRIFNTKAFKAVRTNNEEFYPGYNVSSDDQILKAIQKSVFTVWHAASTCAMQPRSKNGVLDPYLRVYGVTGLRVVDASAFPTLLPGHPQSVCYMLAERAADLLKIARGAPITTVKVTPPPVESALPYSGPN